MAVGLANPISPLSHVFSPCKAPNLKSNLKDSADDETRVFNDANKEEKDNSSEDNSDSDFFDSD